MHDENGEHAELRRKLGDVLQQQRELIDRLQQGQDYFQHLARSVWRVQEEERRRLARELHDGVGHSLTALIHLVAQAVDAMADRPQETRALSRLLRPQILDDLGLEAALRWLARSMHDTHQLAVSLDFDQPFPEVDGDLSTLIFRVTQESLSNCAKHAQARVVEVLLHQRASFVTLSVRDDGRGCDPADAVSAGSKGGSSGLGGMRDRVRLFGGVFRIDSQPNAGFTVSAQFPLSGAAGTLPA